MKKRKPPIIPITILVICAAVAIAFNYKAGLNPNAAAQTPPPTDLNVGPARPTQGVGATASAVKAQMSSAQGTEGRPGMPPMKGPATILNIKQGQSKPVPNDTSVSSQWYQNSSSKSGQ